MSHIIDSMELAQVAAEAEDIARSVNQRLTTAHQLLALFTVPNRAEVLLRDRGLDEDKILAAMTEIPDEPEGLERELRERAREIASGLGAEDVDCLHFLIAMSRVRSSAAHRLLACCGVQVSALRNVALSYFTSRMPRRLQVVAPQPVRSPRTSMHRFNLPPPSPLEKLPEPQSSSAAGGGKESVVLRGRPAEATPLSTPAVPVAPVLPLPEEAPEKAPTTSRSLNPEAFPWLSALGRNLTELAAASKLDPLVGRDREVDEAIDILGKRRSNNPLLVGEPGVGKTAIAEGIAQRLLREGSDRILVEIDVAGIVAGTQLRGSFSEKLNGIKDEVRRAAGRCVVFIDEVHTLIGAGATGEGPQDAANELKAALARGEFPCVGATTHDEYRRHIEKDPALERRFTPVLVREPPVADTIRILQGISSKYAQHHCVEFLPEALEAAASLTARHVTDRFLPDKAISALDLAGSRARREGARTVDAALIGRVVAKMAGIPDCRLIDSDRERINSIAQSLSEHVVGHRTAVERIAAVLRRNYAGFASQRPLGSFLFVGLTGVGKTKLALAVADALYGTKDALIRIDMSECAEATGIARLIGAAPGYVGYGDGGQLTDAVRQRPACVVLLDEIEKAHRDVLMLLLQVLEDGRLTDGRGRQVDFRNAVIILTSNHGGAEATRRSAGIGFGVAAEVGAADSARDNRLLEAVRSALPPELWNRLDEAIFFPALQRDDVKRIASILLKDSSSRLRTERNIDFSAGDDVAEYLLEHGGFDPALGARPMRNVVQRLIEAPLADRILSGQLAGGQHIRVVAIEGQLRFECES